MNLQTDVIIAGGGLAGLAAAVSLGSQGIKTTLVESRPRLGGRASSFLDKPTGEEIDNCQHVALGCCTNYLHFLEQISKHLSDQGNKTSLYERVADYTFIDSRNRFFKLSSDHISAPLHLVRSFQGLKYLSWKDKLAIARGLINLARQQISVENNQSFAAWLNQQKQPANAIKLFWEVVLISALSESLDRISLKYARKVFVDTFLRNRQGMELIIPRVPLSMLYGEAVISLIKKYGGNVLLQSGVEQYEYDSMNNLITGLLLRNGTRLQATNYMSAVPWFNLDQICSPEMLTKINFNRADWTEAPISSVHLWFDQPVIPVKHAVLLERLSQWVFQRHESGNSHSTGSYYYQVVISQSRDLTTKSQQEIIEQVKQELAGIWPEINQAQLIRSRVITEHKAVFSPVTGIDRFRPPATTAIPNFFLAGDWTQTNWPATMEGAVRSGYLAAEKILNSLGIKKNILQDDLPVSYLASLLFKLS